MKICIVTTAPVSCNPRVVKEADALSEAGFYVKVIAAQHAGWAAAWDERLMKNRRWKLEALAWDGRNFSSRALKVSSGLRQRFFKCLSGTFTLRHGFAELGYSRLYSELLRESCREKFDLYIGHNPQALPVAAAAAEKMQALAAFDFEDFHLGEVEEYKKADLSQRLLDYLEKKYVPRLSGVSTASETISRILAGMHKIPPPLVLHNVFPWRERQALDGRTRDRKSGRFSLYWYSQVIGLDRGIQDILRAAPLLSKPVEIHLRGRITGEVKKEILSLARQSSVEKHLFLHDPVHPDELLSRAAEHDVGLALEVPVKQNRDLTVTNKLFFYMLAGLAVAATDTQGQSSVMAKVPEAGFLYPAGDAGALAASLNRWIEAPEILEKTKRASLEAARTFWNWETESRKLVEQVRNILT